MPSPVALAQAQRSGRHLELKVQTENLGYRNQGGVHLRDQAGNTVEVPLKWTAKAGTDDVFAASVEVAATLDEASLTARGFVDVPHQGPLGVERFWADAEVTVTESPEATSARRLIELAAARQELGDVRAKVTAAQQRLATAQTSLDGQLSTVGNLERDLSRLGNELRSARTTRGTVGGAATVFGFLLGGPIGAIIGNAAGFGTLASLDSIERQIRTQEASLSNARARLGTLQRERADIGNEAAALQARGTNLDQKVAELDAATAVPPATEAPAETVERLGRTTAAVNGLIGEYTVLLGDITRLEQRAAALGVTADALRADLERAVAAGKIALEGVQAQIRQVLVSLTLSVISAGAGLGALSSTQATTLKAVIRTADFLTAGDDRKVELLTAGLVAAALPADAAAAAKLASTIVSGLASDTDAGRIAVRAALAAAPNALAEPHRALVTRLLELPNTDPVVGVVNAFVALDAAARKTALESYEALA